jgi:protein-tyrosine phosphatase
MPQILFLCTGNYYRSRFAEFYFRHLAQTHQVGWTSDSRGLAVDPLNPPPMSRDTMKICREMGVSVEPIRNPQSLTLKDLLDAKHVIAVKETEHRPLMQQLFPAWENHIEYWEVHDLDVETPDLMFPQLKLKVEDIFDRLTGCCRI